MKIDFYLRFRTIYGQSLAVSGNLLSLGNNDPSKALPLQFLNGDFWHTSIEVSSADAGLEYHYLFTNEHGETVREGEASRVLTIGKKDSEHVVLIDTWNYS